MSYFQEQTVERIVGTLKEIKTELGKKHFIQIVDKNRKKRLVNIDYIEEIAEIDSERSYIYLAFNAPNAVEQDYFEVNIPYSKLVSMIYERR